MCARQEVPMGSPCDIAQSCLKNINSNWNIIWLFCYYSNSGSQTSERFIQSAVKWLSRSTSRFPFTWIDYDDHCVVPREEGIVLYTLLQVCGKYLQDKNSALSKSTNLNVNMPSVWVDCHDGIELRFWIWPATYSQWTGNQSKLNTICNLWCYEWYTSAPCRNINGFWQMRQYQKLLIESLDVPAGWYAESSV